MAGNGWARSPTCSSRQPRACPARQGPACISRDSIACSRRAPTSSRCSSVSSQPRPASPATSCAGSRRADGAGFAALALAVTGAYYTDPAVRRPIGYPGQQYRPELVHACPGLGRGRARLASWRGARSTGTPASTTTGSVRFVDRVASHPLRVITSPQAAFGDSAPTRPSSPGSPAPSRGPHGHAPGCITGATGRWRAMLTVHTKQNAGQSR